MKNRQQLLRTMLGKKCVHSQACLDNEPIGRDLDVSEY